MSENLNIFISYSHEDANWCARLRCVLKVRANVNAVKTWHDSQLIAGDVWDKEIREELERMDIFLCLVSFDFLASDYITQVEMERAKARYDKREIEIVPLLLYPMNLREDCKFLHDLNPLPAWGKSWREFEQDGGHYKDALPLISKGLKEAIEKRLESKKA